MSQKSENDEGLASPPASSKDNENKLVPEREVIKVARQAAQHVFGVQVATGPAPNALIEKLEPSHITQVINSADKDSSREHVRQLVFFIGGIIGFLGLCLILINQPSVLEKILALFIGFAGGFGTGYAKGKKATN